MNMVDSYLCEVGRWLPGFKRKAQLTRIREDLSEFLSDARDDADRRKRLAEFGRPVVVAALRRLSTCDSRNVGTLLHHGSARRHRDNPSY